MKPGITIVEFTKPAKEYEEEMDKAFVEEAPKGKFSKSVMNELVTAFRDVQRIMGFEGEDLYPLFTEPTVTEFPAEFVRGLAMVAKASEDYGGPSIELSGIKDNAGVATLAAKVRALADDPDFAEFLTSDVAGEEVEEEDDTAETDMDNMFATRM